MFLGALILSEIATADYSLNSHIDLSIDQSVKGNGYFMSYSYARMPNALGNPGENANGVEAKNYAHGSGKINSEWIMGANSSSEMDGGDQYAELMNHTEGSSCITLQEDSQMIYSPVPIPFGVGYYASKPLQYNSLLKEKSWIKNRGSGTSMHNEIEYAHSLDKKLDLLSKNFISEDDPSITQLNVSEEVASGKVHIGLIQIDVPVVEESDLGPAHLESEGFELANSAWRKPLAYVDEDFVGDFNINKNMKLVAEVEEVKTDDDWLPCCSGGWNTMQAYDQKGFGESTEGIFDCTCPKVIGFAEFPR